MTLEVEFKRILPKDGLRFVLIRTATKMLAGGRMDIEVTILNEEMELLCTARQVLLVLEAGRKFGGGKQEIASRM